MATKDIITKVLASPPGSVFQFGVETPDGVVFFLSDSDAEWVEEGQSVRVRYNPEDQFAKVLCFDCGVGISKDGDCPKCGVEYGGGACPDCKRAGLHSNDCPEVLADEGAIADGLASAGEE